jgi:hypothetical protein
MPAERCRVCVNLNGATQKGGAIFLRLKPATIPSAQRDRTSSCHKLDITKLKSAVRVLCRNAVSCTMHRNELLVNREWTLRDPGLRTVDKLTAMRREQGAHLFTNNLRVIFRSS